MTTALVTICMLLAWLGSAAIFAWGWSRLMSVEPPAPHEARRCSHCGSLTHWSLQGRPLCVPCRSREIEGEA
jgi:hypothetical protein